MKQMQNEFLRAFERPLAIEHITQSFNTHLFLFVMESQVLIYSTEQSFSTNSVNLAVD